MLQEIVISVYRNQLNIQCSIIDQSLTSNIQLFSRVIPNNEKKYCNRFRQLQNDND